MTKPRAVGYIRVSSEDRGTLSNQRLSIKEYCDRQGFQWLGDFSDEEQSGATFERPGFKQLITEIAELKYDVVVVNELTRFGRNTAELLRNLKILEKHHVEFRSVREQVVEQSTASGMLMTQILSAISEFELKQIRQRTSDVRLRKWKAKECYVGTPPYGYRFNKATKRLEPVEEEKKTYLRIVELYLDKLKSIEQISSIITDEHRPTRKRDSVWHLSTIAQMLKADIYWSGQHITNTYIYATSSDGRKRGKIIGSRSPDEHIIFQAEPFVSKARWDNIQKRLSDGKSRSGRQAKARDVFMLHKNCVCGICGASLTVGYTTPRVDGTSKRIYVCVWHEYSERKRIVQKRTKCSFLPVDAETLESVVYDRLMEIMHINPEYPVIKLLERAGQKLEELEIKMTNLFNEKNRLEKAKRKHKKILMAFDDNNMEDRIDAVEFKLDLQKLNKSIMGVDTQIVEIKAEIDKIKEQQAQEDALCQWVLKYYDTLFQVQACLRKLPFKAKQNFVRGMLSAKVIIHPFPDDNAILLRSEDDEEGVLARDAEYRLKLEYSVETHFRINMPAFEEALEYCGNPPLGDHVVDPPDPLVPQIGSEHGASDIVGFIGDASTVHEHGLPGRKPDQVGRSLPHVDNVHPQRLRGKLIAGEAMPGQAAADENSHDAKPGDFSFSGKRREERSQARINRKEPDWRKAAGPEKAPRKTRKPFYQPQATPEKVVHDIEDRPGQGLAECEQEDAEKPEGQDHEPQIGYQ
jgi:site-specific DNA recombinase